MGVIQKKPNVVNDKKKNKVKNTIKGKLETNTKFPKVKNTEKPSGPNKNGGGAGKNLEPKKKFEKSTTIGKPTTVAVGSPDKAAALKAKKQKLNKKNKINKQKKQKPKQLEIEDEQDEIPITPDQKKEAIKNAAAIKEDKTKIKKSLKKIVKETVKVENVEKEEASPPKLEGIQVDELIPKDKLKKNVKNLFKIIKHTKESTDKKKSLTHDQNFLTLSILAMKIPDCPNRNPKISYPFPLYSTESDVCLFVSDLQRGRKRDDEPMVQHYEEILAKNGVTCINKIMTVSHLINEYQSYELKSRLANSYDVFLVEGKVSTRVGKFLGKLFSNIKKNPIAIKDFEKETIEQTLNTITYRQSSLGPMNMINFGFDTMSENEVTENLYYLLNKLKHIYPGGWTNIKSLTLCALKEITYPIMYNFANPNAVPIPRIASKNQEKIDKEKALLDGVLRRVEINSDGVVVKSKVTKRKLEEDDAAVEVKVESSSPPKSKKKKNKNSELNVEIESDIVPKVEIGTTPSPSKKDKKTKKNKVVVEEVPVVKEEIVEEEPQTVDVGKNKKKNKKKNETANFNGVDNSVETIHKKTKGDKFEQPDKVKPKKKKLNKN